MNTATSISDALYYPYIHMRNEDWLKGTLLFFPHIMRMLPSTFEPKDSDFVHQLKQTEGRSGQPLVQSYPFGEKSEDVDAHNAILKLVNRIAEDAKSEAFKNRFTMSATEAQAKEQGWVKGPNTFQIHRGKLSEEISARLRDIDLAWDPLDPDGQDRTQWMALHPRIGEALMATAAAAIALDGGLEIVTDSPRVHGIAATRDEEAIYQVLVSGQADAAKGPDGGSGRAGHELQVAQLVFASRFVLSQLTVHDLAAISRETDAFYGFRQLIAKRVAEVPQMRSQEKLENHLKGVADEIGKEWEEQRRTLSNFLNRFKGEGLITAGKGALEEIVKAALSGTTAGVTAGAVAGVAGTSLLTTVASALAPTLLIGFGVHTFQTWRSFNTKGPTTFLSLIEDRIGTTLGVASPPLAS